MLHYANNQLLWDDHCLSQLADQFGTALYVYNEKQIINQYQNLSSALQKNCTNPIQIHFAVKSNHHLAILNCFKALGSGFDIVSGGELKRLIKIEISAQNIIFSGVGKKAAEIKLALDYGINCFNVESKAELEQIINIAQSLHKKAAVAIRVNPDIDAKTHPYISTGLKSNKFGLSFGQAFEIYQQYHTHTCLDFVGLSCHIGSQITDLSAYKAAYQKVAQFAEKLIASGINIQSVNLGGGIGVDYQQQKTISFAAYAQLIDQCFKHLKLKLIIEPGRSLIAKAGILITQVLYLKDNGDYHFCIVDAAMTELIRPSLYQAYHPILPLVKKDGEIKNWQIVGPVCESADILGSDRKLAIEKTDLLAITHAGAYGSVMSSNYNCRTKIAEVLLTEKNKIKLISQRQTDEQTWQNEIF